MGQSDYLDSRIIVPFGDWNFILLEDGVKILSRTFGLRHFSDFSIVLDPGVVFANTANHKTF